MWSSSDRWQRDTVRTRLHVVAALADRAGELLAALRDDALGVQNLASRAAGAGEAMCTLSNDRWQGEAVRTRLGVVATLADGAGEPPAALRDDALRAQDLESRAAGEGGGDVNGEQRSMARGGG